MAYRSKGYGNRNKETWVWSLSSKWTNTNCNQMNVSRKSMENTWLDRFKNTTIRLMMFNDCFIYLRINYNNMRPNKDCVGSGNLLPDTRSKSPTQYPTRSFQNMISMGYLLHILYRICCNWRALHDTFFLKLLNHLKTTLQVWTTTQLLFLNIKHLQKKVFLFSKPAEWILLF